MLIFHSIERLRGQGFWLMGWLMGWLSLWLSLSGMLNAAPSPKDSMESEAVAYISLIALGAVPARRYGEDEGLDSPESINKKKRGASTALLPPLEGSVPPSILYYNNVLEKSENNNDAWCPIRVGYNRGSPSVKVPAGVSLAMHIRNGGLKAGYAQYLKIPPLQAGAQVLCFLALREKGKLPWMLTPKISMLDLNSQALRDKNFLVRNFSDASVSYIINDRKPDIVTSGQRRSFKLDQSISYHRVAAIEGLQRRLIIHASVKVPDKAFTVFAFYNNTNPQTNTGKSVGVFRATLKRYPVEVFQAGEKVEK
jgi:hypothetical protein